MVKDLPKDGAGDAAREGDDGAAGRLQDRVGTVDHFVGNGTCHSVGPYPDGVRPGHGNGAAPASRPFTSGNARKWVSTERTPTIPRSTPDTSSGTMEGGRFFEGSSNLMMTPPRGSGLTDRPYPTRAAYACKGPTGQPPKTTALMRCLMTTSGADCSWRAPTGPRETCASHPPRPNGQRR